MVDTTARGSLPNRPWSLYRRLAIGLVLAVGGVLCAMFFALDHWIDRQVYRQMDNALIQHAGAVAHTLGLQEDLAHLEQLMPEYGQGGHTQFFSVYDSAGRPVLDSPNSNGRSLPIGKAGGGLPRFLDVTLPDGHSGRALVTRLPARTASESPDLLVVASERESWDKAERRIHYALLGATVLALGLVVVLGRLVVGHVFSVLRTAGRRISNLDAASPLHPIGEGFPVELQPFATAFNTGVQRLYDALERERRFADNVAHELRTPLTEIRTSAESAQITGEPAELETHLRGIVAASERMQRSVDTLMFLARLESGQSSPSLDPLELGALVRECVDAHRSVALERGIALHAELPQAAWVRSDVGIIERILANLMHNAIEYAPPGSEASCSLREDAQGWWLEVANPAPALAPEDLRHLGQRFWRKQSEGGTADHAGLGLSLAVALAGTLDLQLKFRLDDGRLVAGLGPWSAL